LRSSSARNRDRQEGATAYVTEKAVGLVTRPRGVVTVIFPVFAPVGTAVTSLVALSLVILAAVPSKLTAVAPERLMPLRVTVVPGLPEVGEKLSIVGAVEMITAPPLFVSPVAQQSVLVGHDMPPRELISLGRAWDFQVLPPLMVATTTPAYDGTSPTNDKLYPTAQQSVLVAHDTPPRKLIPLGRAWDFQLLPPLIVATTTGALEEAFSPTAQQSVLVAHDTPPRSPMPLGRAWDFQVLPPLLVATTAASDEVLPAAQQSVLVGHETAPR